MKWCVRLRAGSMLVQDLAAGGAVGLRAPLACMVRSGLRRDAGLARVLDRRRAMAVALVPRATCLGLRVVREAGCRQRHSWHMRIPVPRSRNFSAPVYGSKARQANGIDGRST